MEVLVETEQRGMDDDGHGHGGASHRPREWPIRGDDTRPGQAVRLRAGSGRPGSAGPGRGRIRAGGSQRCRGAEVRAGIGYVPEDYRVGYAWMTVGRLLEHQAVYHPSWDAEYARQLRARYEIDPGRKCHTLSKGQSRRVQLVLALAHRLPLLLLDEPTDGLDHVVRDETLSILSEHLADSPTTVVVSTHRVYEVEPLVDHVGVLAEGRLLGQLPRDELHGGLLRYWAESRRAPVGLLRRARRSAPSARGVEGRAPLGRHPAVVTACRSPEARARQGRGGMGLAHGDPGCGPRVGHAHGAQQSRRSRPLR